VRGIAGRGGVVLGFIALERMLLTRNARIKKKIKAKPYMTNGSSYMGKYWRISSYIRKPFLIYDFPNCSTSEFPYI
jgi:hypothetical protein